MYSEYAKASHELYGWLRYFEQLTLSPRMNDVLWLYCTSVGILVHMNRVSVTKYRLNAIGDSLNI